MAQDIVSVYQTSFDALVKQSYQGAAKLLGAVRTANNVVGSTHKFRKIGKGVAQARGALQTDITPMNVDYSDVTATLSDWVAPEYSDIFSQPKVNFDEMSLLAQVCANAIGRRLDQLVINAMDDSAFATTVSDDLGGSSSGLNIEKLRRAKRLLDANGVPTSDRYFVHSAYGLEQLLGETEITSADFATVRALVNGEVDTFMGFKFIMIEDRANEGGLPLAANVRTNYAFHGNAMGSVGLAVGMNVKTETNYIPEKTSWLINSMFSAGSVTIDTDGVIKVYSYEA